MPNYLGFEFSIFLGHYERSFLIISFSNLASRFSMKTIRERIIQGFVAQLESITRINGYSVNIGTGHVYRGVPVIDQNNPPSASVWELSEQRKRNTSGGTVRVLKLRIESIIETHDDQHPMAVSNQLLGDLEAAMMLYDTAMDSLLDDIQDVAAEVIHLPLDQQMAAVTLDFELHYTTEWGNPYKKA